MRFAVKADPLSSEVHRQFSDVLLSAHRYQEAESEARHVEGEPARSWFVGRALMGQGRMREAIDVFATAVARGVGPNQPIRGYLAYAYARTGRRDEAEKIVAADERPFHQLLAFAGLGDKDRAFAALERMVPSGPIRVGRALICPELESLRADPRMKAVRKKVGLPE
jgi:hypothetical protein